MEGFLELSTWLVSTFVVAANDVLSVVVVTKFHFFVEVNKLLMTSIL